MAAHIFPVEMVCYVIIRLHSNFTSPDKTFRPKSSSRSLAVEVDSECKIEQGQAELHNCLPLQLTERFTESLICPGHKPTSLKAMVLVQICILNTYMI